MLDVESKCTKLLSCACLYATLWTVAHQAPLSMGLSRQEYKSGSLCPPPGDLPAPAIKPLSLLFPALAGRFWESRHPRVNMIK